MKPEDIDKVKSGPMALYIFSHAFQPIATANRWTYYQWIRPELLLEKHPNRSDALVILIDDFVGSGETAVSAVNDFVANWAVSSDALVVASLVAQQLAVDALTTIGVPLLSPHVRQRGISDSNLFADINAAHELMDGIERRLKVNPDYRRGFRQSEALVTMQRCPNNTFPIYWTTKRKWPAPFPR